MIYLQDPILLYGVFGAPVDMAGSAPPAPPGGGSGRDPHQIIGACYDSSAKALRVTVVGVASVNYGTNLDWMQVLKKVVDPATNTLRVVTLT